MNLPCDGGTLAPPRRLPRSGRALHVRAHLGALVSKIAFWMYFLLVVIVVTALVLGRYA